MSAQASLFDVDLDEGQDEWDLRPGDDAWASCRFCQTATTAAGIDNRGHGPGSATCARMLTWPTAEPR